MGLTPDETRELRTMTPEQSVEWRPFHPGGSTDILPFFVSVAPRIPKGGTYVEIGTFFGRSLAFMGTLRPDLVLYAVDPWLEGFVDAGETLPVGPDLELCRLHGSLFQAFLAKMNLSAPEVLGRTNIIRAPSARGLRVLDNASSDFTFIDGDHGIAAVEEDCRQALRITKPGGIIAGHDMLPPWGNEVCVAVANVLGPVELAPWPVAREGWAEGKSSCFWIVRPPDEQIVRCNGCGVMQGLVRPQRCWSCGSPTDAPVAGSRTPACGRCSLPVTLGGGCRLVGYDHDESAEAPKRAWPPALDPVEDPAREPQEPAVP